MSHLRYSSTRSLPRLPSRVLLERVTPPVFYVSRPGGYLKPFCKDATADKGEGAGPQRHRPSCPSNLPHLTSPHPLTPSSHPLTSPSHLALLPHLTSPSHLTSPLHLIPLPRSLISLPYLTPLPGLNPVQHPLVSSPCLNPLSQPLVSTPCLTLVSTPCLYPARSPLSSGAGEGASRGQVHGRH